MVVTADAWRGMVGSYRLQQSLLHPPQNPSWTSSNGIGKINLCICRSARLHPLGGYSKTMQGPTKSTVFLGSCTNSRDEDPHRRGHHEGRHIAGSITAYVVPGSQEGQTHGGDRGARQDISLRRMRVAGAGLLHVHRDERRRGACEILRIHVQPQFRGQAGQGARTILMSPRWLRSPPSKDTSRTCVRTRAQYRYTNDYMALLNSRILRRGFTDSARSISSGY